MTLSIGDDLGDDDTNSNPWKKHTDPNGGIWSLQVQGASWVAINERPDAAGDDDAKAGVIYPNKGVAVDQEERSLGGKSFKLRWLASELPMLTGQLAEVQPQQAIDLWARANKSSAEAVIRAKAKTGGSWGWLLLALGAVVLYESQKRGRKRRR
jgi:hypothetical protein